MFWKYEERIEQFFSGSHLRTVSISPYSINLAKTCRRGQSKSLCLKSFHHTDHNQICILSMLWRLQYAVAIWPVTGEGFKKTLKTPAKPNYHMSIKKSQAILKCFIDLKNSVRRFTLGSEDETMVCDT